jgi:UDP-N-acetylmuramoylalanine--D-glutamate ligase
MLVLAGRQSAAVGNVGYAISDAALRRWDSLVVEASSFQLRFSDTFHPKAAALLNLAPDHFDWHGSLASYQAAKQKIFQNQTTDDLLVFDADDPGARQAVAGARSRLLAVSARRRVEGGWGVADDALHLPGIQVAVDEMATSDPSFLVDLAAAGLLALELGAGTEAVAQCLRTFQPGAHRRRVVAVIDGVSYVDDSKATNPHSALAAVAAFPSVVLIAGGLAKGLDVTPLAVAPNLRFLVAIGEAAPVLLAAARVPAVAASTMEAAVEAAAERAASGDVVLLAPGCASFDMFSDYAHRGDEFIRLVNEMSVRVEQ